MGGPDPLVGVADRHDITTSTNLGPGPISGFQKTTILPPHSANTHNPITHPLEARLYDPSYCKDYHAFVDVPTIRGVSYNIRTFSGMATCAVDVERQSRLITNILSCSRDADVLLLQETKAPPEAVYDVFRAEWMIFDNPLVTVVDGEVKAVHKAGTVILVRRSFAHNFVLSDKVVVPGYIQQVVFTPRNYVSQDRPYFSRTFSVSNVYLHSTNNTTKLNQISQFGAHPDDSEFSFAGGDWNVKFDKNDTILGKPSDPKVCKALTKALERRRLLEIWHPAMTKISNHTPPRISKLDRWFSSHTPGERQVMEPSVWLPPHPHEPGMGASPSDHFPIMLSFQTTKRYTGWRKVPKWLAEHPSFAKMAEEKWAKTTKNCDPCELLWRFNRVLQNTARDLLKSRKVRTEDRANARSIAIATFSKLVACKTSVEEAYADIYRDTSLSSSISPGQDKEALIDSLQNFLWAGSEDPTRPAGYDEARAVSNDRVRSYLPRQPKTRVDYNQKIKKAHCAKRSGLSFLVDDAGNRVTDAKGMAALLKKAWEPIWGGSAAPTEASLAYLQSYRKKVGEIEPEISLSDVINEVLVKRNSCPGPNGIPFACYSALCDLSAPILLAVCQFLMAGGSPKDDFNTSLLFFLPKDGTGQPRNNRPIAASNTDNRLIANIVRRKLEGKCHEILERNQTGFVRTRSIEENILFFNHKFYDALYSRYRSDLPAPDTAGARRNLSRGQGHDYNICCLDYAKAFDSVSRDFLFLLLETIGIPAQYITIIRALYHNVQALPALHSRTNCIIEMKDGLKQGCPLSPILFILAMDPLLTLIGTLPRVDSFAFADDVALGARDPTDLIPALLMIDAWSCVSRVLTNVKKTKLISTSAAPVMFTHLAPPHWSMLTYVDTYVYLGVLIGRSANVTKVFDAAVEKFEGRVSSFMPMQRYHNMPGRVRLANTYLLPLFSYLFRFFLMSEETAKRVERKLRKWLIRGTCTNLDRLAAPTHLLGLASPLRDLSKLNLAVILRHREARPNPRLSGAYSMLCDDHFDHAAISFQAITGSAFPPQTSQTDLVNMLTHSDPKPLDRLVKTISERLVRHGRGEDAKQLVHQMASNALRLPAALKPALRNHLFNIVHQCLFTNHRARNFGSSTECMFCDSPVEDINHLFVECRVAKETIRLMHGHSSRVVREAGAFLASATIADHRFETKALDVQHMRALLCFSQAIWRTRRFYRDRTSAPSLERAPQRALMELGPLLQHWVGGGRRHKDVEKKAFQAALRLLPPEACFVYTDGSSYGNPGPAGAGFAVSHDHKSFVLLGSRSLGPNTNNVAELCAIQDATEHLLDDPDDSPIFIFTDNRLAMSVSLGRVTPSWALATARKIRSNIDELSIRRRVNLFWVPGHADIPGNELADKLAKLGSAGVTGSWLSPEEIPTEQDPPPVEGHNASHRSGACEKCSANITNLLDRRFQAQT